MFVVQITHITRRRQHAELIKRELLRYCPSKIQSILYKFFQKKSLHDDPGTEMSCKTITHEPI
jgi:hypothetical protein